MPIVRFDPFKGFEKVVNKMNNIISDAEKGIGFEYGNFSPRVDIIEDENKLYVMAELAGINKEDVKITVNEENILVIKGEKKAEKGCCDDKESDKCYLRVERNYGTFSRSFMLPDNIKKDSISAKFDNGVLEISLEKEAPVAPKEIHVDIA